MKTKNKAKWLAHKGYTIADKSREYIENLYALYHPAESRKSVKPWKQWEGTNRLHHFR